MSQLILDVETYGLAEAADFLEPPTAPSNYKDETKIAAYIEKAKAESLARCALDVDLCRIVCAGWVADGDGVRVAVAKDAHQECDLLRTLWSLIGAHAQIVGFNVLGFDLPVLIRRSQYLGVETVGLSLDRYRTPHLDLMEFLSFNGKLKYRSLDFYCRRFGIDVVDDHNGKDIDALVKAGDWDAVAAHCRADLTKTRRLAERLGVLSAVETV